MQRWATLNFPLDAKALLVIAPNLRLLFPNDMSESRIFQLLTHAIVPVPSYADLNQTARYQDYSDAKHRIQSLHGTNTRPSHVVSFAFNGDELGDDRTVRANVPFPSGFHIAVFQRRKSSEFGKPLYQIGLVASGYFEIQIMRRERETEHQEGHERQQIRFEEELTSLGLVSSTFPLVGRQPGWNQKSYGYHGDDGRFYCKTTRGQLFGPRFGVNDIVGCGVRQNGGAAQSHVFFTYNVRVNFGQEPFAYDSVIDELFAECDSSAFDMMDLPWYCIQEYCIECLVWRHQQTSTAQARSNSDNWKDAISKKPEMDEENKRNKWVTGILTRRQQNRLAMSELNTNDELAM
ncbi:SPRY domain-containing proteins [Plasmopara halstedii]|uniref:SPRY domain-containing proteins n=1 Tax=Plasmopara halstedii TaxID=4781 RepID=A0A0P1AQB0_PLAHL|nr:SPRY domain-containing proteins [Plasmopara halstedii]CEG43488.1 SPRY domain-containing proteins [Plasmopara halstedii]|eukprot:XP_024579857.1 SPRY domain-containing proteins [Plasmopara halstedii]